MGLACHSVGRNTPRHVSQNSAILTIVFRLQAQVFFEPTRQSQVNYCSKKTSATSLIVFISRNSHTICTF